MRFKLELPFWVNCDWSTYPKRKGAPKGQGRSLVAKRPVGPWALTSWPLAAAAMRLVGPLRKLFQAYAVRGKRLLSSRLSLP